MEPSVQLQKVQIRIGELTREGNRILILRIADGAELDVPDIEELFLKARHLMKGEPYCLITDARASLQATKEAREYAADKLHANNIIANAIITNSLPVNLLVNFYIRFNRPEVPTHMFTTEEHAREWVSSILKVSK